MLILQIRLFCCLFSFSFSFFFSVSHFSIFFNVKNGATPLYIAAQNGHEQIVQILLEKGKANIDLAEKVCIFFVIYFFLILFHLVSFSFFFFLFSFFTFSLFYFFYFFKS